MAKTQAGMIFDQIEPGSFYRSTQPGHWTCAVTGIIIPGFEANLSSDGARSIDSVSEVYEPVQIPHFKEVVNYLDKDRKVEERTLAPFDRPDQTPLHDSLNMALNTGIIQKVSDQDMQKYYPETWAKRREKYIYSSEKKEQKPMAEMFDDFFAQREERKKEEARIAAAKAEADLALQEAASIALTEMPPPLSD